MCECIPCLSAGASRAPDSVLHITSDDLAGPVHAGWTIKCMSGMSCAEWNVKSLACMRRRNWDITAIALTIYTLLVLPFRAAFYWEYYRDLEMHHNVIEQLEVHSSA